MTLSQTNSETDQGSLSDMGTAGSAPAGSPSSKPRRPIMTIRLRDVAFKAAWGSKRAYVLQALAAEETQVNLPWAAVLFCGMVVGAGVTALAYQLL